MESIFASLSTWRTLEGNHEGSGYSEEYRVSSRSHGCDNGGSRQRERTARFQRERFQGPAQRVVLNMVPTTRLDGEFPRSFNDLRNYIPSLLKIEELITAIKILAKTRNSSLFFSFF